MRNFFLIFYLKNIFYVKFYIKKIFFIKFLQKKVINILTNILNVGK